MAVRINKMGTVAALAGLAVLPAAAIAEVGDVVLRLKNSGVEFAGSLRSFDGRKYVVEARAFGVLSLDADRFECLGERCAAPPRKIETAAVAMAVFSGADERVDRFAIQGSDTVGRELMPALIRDYARSLGGSARQLTGGNPNEAQFKVMDAGGSVVSVIDVARTNPAAAFGSVSRGAAAIAMSSRPIQATEAASLAKLSPKALASDHEHVIALDGMAVVVAADSRVQSLPIDKLAGIFSGKISNWSEVGLPSGPINLYVGSDSDGSTDAFSDLVLKPGRLAIAPSATRIAGEVEVSDAVARDPNGIGVTSYAFLRNARALGISASCGLKWSPSEFSIKAEEYPLSRRLYLYSAGTAGSGAAERLIKFANSSAAQGTIGSSQFMDQSVVSETFAEQGSRVSDWLEKSGAGSFEKSLAQNLVAEIKDARRMSLTFRFALASSQLDAKARQDLTRLVELMQGPAFKGKTLMLLGFTDAIGTPESNAALALRRASEVRDAVFAAAPAGSIDPKLVMVEGYGAVSPVACNDGDAGMNRNRRVEVWVRDRAPAPKVAAAAPQPEPIVRRAKPNKRR